MKYEMSNPYLRGQRTTNGIMRDVVIALMPALLGGVYFFGLTSLYLCVVAVSVCVISEYIWQKWKHIPTTMGDFSAVVTGILIAFQFPVTTPIWIIVVASLFSIIVVKQMFGGIGGNFLNPALMGRMLIMTLWPGVIMQYILPRTVQVDAITSATALSNLKVGIEAGSTYWQMFIGEVPGAIGETSKVLLLIGFGYLCFRKIVNINVVISYIMTVMILTFTLGPKGLFTGDILGNLFGGSLILGACFMLTDYSFSSKSGKILFGIVAGVITAVIRIYSNYPEGVCIGILAANCLAGIMEAFYRSKIYGVKNIATVRK